MTQREVMTEMERMYRAGRHDIPDTAYDTMRVSFDLYDSLDDFNVQAALAGDPAIMRSMLTVAGDLYEALRMAVLTLNNCAAAVIATANDYAQSDEQAKADFERLDRSLKDWSSSPSAPPPEIKDPEAPGASTTVTTGEDNRGEPIEKDKTIPSTPQPVTPGDDHQKHDEQESESEREYQRRQRSGQ